MSAAIKYMLQTYSLPCSYLRIRRHAPLTRAFHTGKNSMHPFPLDWRPLTEIPGYATVHTILKFALPIHFISASIRSKR